LNVEFLSLDEGIHHKLTDIYISEYTRSTPARPIFGSHLPMLSLFSSSAASPLQPVGRDFREFPNSLTYHQLMGLTMTAYDVSSLDECEELCSGLRRNEGELGKECVAYNYCAKDDAGDEGVAGLKLDYDCRDPAKAGRPAKAKSFAGVCSYGKFPETRLYRAEGKSNWQGGMRAVTLIFDRFIQKGNQSNDCTEDDGKVCCDEDGPLGTLCCGDTPCPCTELPCSSPSSMA